MLFALIVVATPLFGQTDLDTSLLLGRVVPPEPVPAQSTTATTLRGMSNSRRAIKEAWTEKGESPVRPQLLLATSYITNDSVDIAQVTAGALWEAKRPFRATLTYGDIESAGSSDGVKSYGGGIRWKVVSTDNTGLTLLGAYSDTQNTSAKTQFGAASEFAVGGDVTLGLNGIWVRNEKATTNVQDVVVTATAGLNLNTVIVAMGYTLDNDVAGEDSISAELQIPTSAGSFSVVIAKHQTISFNWQRKFLRK
jgi:hypothetical protein